MNPTPPASSPGSSLATDRGGARIGARRWLRIIAKLAALAVGAGVLALLLGVALVAWLGRGADAIDPEQLRDYHPAQVSRVLARDGTLIGELVFKERRTVVAWEALPEHVVHAFLAAEDADFFEHHGLDWLAIARALLTNAIHGEARQGASTITQQVIKNTLLGPDRTLERKSQELILAGRVEAVLSKQEIFEIYVNEVYFGEGRYGVEEAARYYCGKSIAEVDLAEAAMLAVLPRSPGRVTPYRDAALLERRQEQVLERMVALGYADSDQAAAAREAGLPALPRDAERERQAIGEADEFVELARRELVRRHGEDQLAQLGATVRTSVDLDVQRAARAGALEQLAALEARHGYGAHARPLAAKARRRLDARAPARLRVDERHTVVVTAVQGSSAAAQLGPHHVEVELPPDATPERFPIGSAISVRITRAAQGAAPAYARLEPGPEVALALADVRSGELVALLGGRAFRRGEFERSHEARRQPGSTFKPIVYGAALASGRFTPASRGRGGPQGEPMRLREALAQSDNAVALALQREVGVAVVHSFARELGLERPLGDQPSLALGTSELSPIELLTAYLTLARSGLGVEPSAVLDIEVPPDLQGRSPEPSAAPRPTRRFETDARVAALTTSMLRSVVDEGTARLAQQLERPVAGKTGTTNDARDVWFAGYTPDHAAVVWVGFDDARSLGTQESGSNVALPIWLAAMREAEADLPAREFDEVPGLERVVIDRETAAPACRERSEWLRPERCERGIFWDSCTPAQWVAHAPFLQCSDPARWLDELFLAGTAPTRTSPDQPFGEPPSEPDPHERSGPPPQVSEVEVVELSLFADTLTPEQREPVVRALARVQARVNQTWQAALIAARRERVEWGQPPPSVGSRVRLALRLSSDARLVHSRVLASSGDERLDAWADAALRAASTGGLSLPTVMLEPSEREAELVVELVVGEAAQL